MSRIPEEYRRKIIGQLQLRGRTYHILEHRENSRAWKERGERRYPVFSPEAGPEGNLCVVHEFDRHLSNPQYLDSLKRLGRYPAGGYPFVRECITLRERVYVVTDWIWGRPLRDYLDGAKKVENQGEKSASTITMIQMFHPFGRDLCKLHGKQNMIHGDLKPENLVVRRGTTRLAMIDFGSAWRIPKTVHRDEGDGRTQAYAAPEAWRRESFVDFRADIFSASVIFFEMLTLELPYGECGGAVDPDRAHNYVPPSEIASKWMPFTARTWKLIDRVVETGLKLNREERYQSSESWQKDLEAMRSAIQKHHQHESEDLPLPFFNLLRRLRRWLT